MLSKTWLCPKEALVRKEMKAMPLVSAQMQGLWVGGTREHQDRHVFVCAGLADAGFSDYAGTIEVK